MKKAAAKISPGEILPPAGEQTETHSNIKKRGQPGGRRKKQIKNNLRTHTQKSALRAFRIDTEQEQNFLKSRIVPLWPQPV